ncbi:MAG: dTDP-4-dehydrorhamnose reductase [Candidatus Kerfeldbacteria bacterium]|nr:dTDP-4-dehydrorhamnose reductase [Candidatus Kerfeldbacteria bacterium]
MIQSPIIILGGKGMLGQYLVDLFSDRHTLVWDKEELDITDLSAVKEQLASVAPKIVINAAAYNAVDQAETDEGFAIAEQVNAQGPKNLAEVCAQLGAVFVHYSTDYVFDGTKKEGYTETDAPNPKSRYALSKFHGEQAVVAAGGYVIRTCKLFGHPGSSDGSKKSFVDLMLTLAETKTELNVVNEEYASPTYVRDLAQQTRLILEQEYAPGIYHVTNTGACTWYEFAQEIFHQKGITITLNPVPASRFPRPALRPAYSVLLNTKLPPMRSWQEALADYLQQ